MKLDARREVIRRCTTPQEIPGCGVQVLTCPEPLPVWQALEAASGGVEGPPFWAHAWPGGIVLAEWVALHEAEVRGQRVLDFAAGGGLAGLVARKRGAAEVVCSELDPWAIAAIEENAALNALEVCATSRDLVGVDEGWSLVLVGDVFYEREPAALIFAWLQRLHARGAQVLIGDPGRSFLPRERLRLVATSRTTAVPAWDSVTDRPARLWTVAS